MNTVLIFAKLSLSAFPVSILILIAMESVLTCDYNFIAIVSYKHVTPGWILMDLNIEPLNDLTNSYTILERQMNANIFLVLQYHDSAFREEANKIGSQLEELNDNLLDLLG